MLFELVFFIITIQQLYNKMAKRNYALKSNLQKKVY